MAIDPKLRCAHTACLEDAQNFDLVDVVASAYALIHAIYVDGRGRGGRSELPTAPLFETIPDCHTRSAVSVPLPPGRGAAAPP